ncbi:MAG: NUDIX domain-containing protein, partial [Phycisphaerales bacterium]|nr:NUDIX domain-containing protein [Phycisphaerales bacterium]
GPHPPPPPPQVLVTQRPLGTICAGAWEFPGGKLEQGEPAAAAAAREALEEVALHVRPEAALEVVVHTYPHGTVRLTPWVCLLDPPGQSPRNVSVAAHKWVTLAEIAELDFLAGNAEILTNFTAWLANRGPS